MTEQHHQFQKGKKLSWRVGRLVQLASNLQVFDLKISEIFEIDSVYWFDNQHQPTCRAIVEHAKRIREADFSRPIILSERGLVMDGMHRVCKALLEGQKTVRAVQFSKDPKPDKVDVL